MDASLMRRMRKLQVALLLRDGGSNELSNLELLCRDCHRLAQRS
jgi:hypothetical protein